MILHCMILCTVQVVDGEVVMLSAHWERRRGALLELQEQLQQIPAFLTDLESITARVGETDTEHTQLTLKQDISSCRFSECSCTSPSSQYYM